MKAPRGKVLIADDEPAIALNLSGLLELEGYEVMVATGGPEALALLSSYHPDIVVTDLSMPEVTGLDLIHYCTTQLLDTAVILMTGYWSLESAVSALRLGAYDYVLKPCEPPLLLAAVARAAERRDLVRELEQRRRLDAVTQMALTISHEVNNPLGVMLGLVQLHLDVPSDSSPLPEALRADLQTIESHIRRISEVLRNLASLQKLVTTDAGLGDGSKMLTDVRDEGQ